MSDYKITVGDTDIDCSYVVNNVAIYNVTVDVIRDTVVVSALGNARTPVVIVNDMACEIKWLSGRERVLFNKDTHILDAILKCRVPAGVTITNTDRVYFNSQYYDIVDVIDFNNLGVLLEIGIRKVE